MLQNMFYEEAKDVSYLDFFFFDRGSASGFL